MMSATDLLPSHREPDYTQNSRDTKVLQNGVLGTAAETSAMSWSQYDFQCLHIVFIRDSWEIRAIVRRGLSSHVMSHGLHWRRKIAKGRDEDTYCIRRR